MKLPAKFQAIIDAKTTTAKGATPALPLPEYQVSTYVELLRMSETLQDVAAVFHAAAQLHYIAEETTIDSWNDDDFFRAFWNDTALNEAIPALRPGHAPDEAADDEYEYIPLAWDENWFLVATEEGRVIMYGR